MNITLRKANAVQNSINDTVKGIKMEFNIELNEFQDVEAAILVGAKPRGKGMERGDLLQ